MTATPLAVYVHVPWCLQRCPYCDFDTDAVAVRDIPHEAYAIGVQNELRFRAPSLSEHTLQTVFFGGGTPSLWSVNALASVLRSIEATFGAFASEITVECNPTSLDADRALALRDIGVTRVSIGVQSLQVPHLRYLGRLHDAESARRAVHSAAQIAGLRVTADLMFGMPSQTAEELLSDARTLLDLGVGHFSAYALTVEPRTRFGELARKGRLPRLADDAVALLFEALEAQCAPWGLEHYEVSNYALEGQQGQHNEAYWRGADYLGLGVGAVGCYAREMTEKKQSVRYKTVYDIARYIADGQAAKMPQEEPEPLDAETLVREGLMLGLRTALGVNLADLQARTGLDPRAGRERAIARAVKRDNLEDLTTHLRIPRAKWLTADDIIAGLF
ncbi:MAG: radical SAM family heme chaperone HemW [Deltaproteobacteria bacterium]|nr:radical SAM family heme chaperone HemW [Deltaproteobacteria bacterium]